MSGEEKPTFAQLLERHGINLTDFYVQAKGIPGQDIQTLYEKNLALAWELHEIVETLNTMTGESYTSDDIYMRYIYGVS